MKRRHLRDDAIAPLRPRCARCGPDIVFGADLIAGFPTETEAMFAQHARRWSRRRPHLPARLSLLRAARHAGGAHAAGAPAPVRKERAARLRAAGERGARPLSRRPRRRGDAGAGRASERRRPHRASSRRFRARQARAAARRRPLVDACADRRQRIDWIAAADPRTADRMSEPRSAGWFQRLQAGPEPRPRPAHRRHHRHLHQAKLDAGGWRSWKRR